MAAPGIMGLGYNIDGTKTSSMDQLSAHGVPNSFGLYMCPAYAYNGGASGTGPGADKATALGQLSLDTVESLTNSSLVGSTATNSSAFTWIKVFSGVTW